MNELKYIDYIGDLYKSVSTSEAFQEANEGVRLHVALAIFRAVRIDSLSAVKPGEDPQVDFDNKLAEKQFEKVASDATPKVIFGTLEARKKVADGRFTKYVITVDGKEYFTFSDDLRDDVRKLANDTVVKLTLHAKTQGEFIAIAAHGEQPEF